MNATTGLRRPPGRYDEPRTLPRPLLVGGAVVLLTALLGFSYVAYRHYASTRAAFTNLDYRVASDSSVLIRFRIALDKGETAQCVLQARDRDNVEVGSVLVTLTGKGSSPFTVERTLPTKHRAVAGEVLSCRRAP
jgi:hypothetical protein